jgi:hypothetical protein
VIAVRAYRTHGASSSYARLAAYILNETKTDGEIRISNCGGAETSEEAITLVRATQGMNARARGDRTYHLVVSFPPGERPTPEQLRDIEDSLCAAAGLGEHQRISGGHVDRDHYHFHVAVNKVHPTTFRFVEPYYDQIKLNQACARLEIAHGLVRTNHGERPNQAAPERAEKGNLSGWIQDNAVPSVLAALDRGGSWRELHGALANFGLAIKPRGAGLIIVQEDAEGDRATVKASSVDRRLSVKALTARLGAFEPPEAARAPRAEASDGKRRAAGNRDRPGGRTRNKAGPTQGAPRISAPSREAARAPEAEDEEDLPRIVAAHPRAGQDASQAGGVIDGLLNWRRRRASEELLTAETPEEARRVVFSGLRSRSLGDGSVVHHVRDGGRVVDEVSRSLLRVEEVSAHAVYLSLALAEERFAGQALIVDGDAAFKRQLVETAAAHRLGVCFADAALETERQRLMASQPVLAAPAAGASLRPAASPRIPSAAEVYARDQEAARQSMPLIEPHRLWTPGDAGEAAYHGSRWFADGSEAILLKKDGEILVKPAAPGETAEASRWTVGRKVMVNRRGALADPALESENPAPVPQAPAMDAWIRDREAARQGFPAIEPHRLWTPEDAGEAAYHGRRGFADGSEAILLKQGGEILVKPATAEQAAEAGHWIVGRTVAVDRQGRFAGPAPEAPEANRPAAPAPETPGAGRQRHAPQPGFQTPPTDADQAAAGYVRDRNAARQKIPSIEPHRLWIPEDAGEAVYGGRRRLADGSTALLLKKGGEVLVKPATAEQAAQAGLWTMGRSVAVDRQGQFAGARQSKKRGR